MKYTLCFWVAIVLPANLISAQKTPNPLCPYPSDDFVRFPFQGDCKKFWECYQGQRYPMSCPDDLDYNQEKEVCDFPSEANCDSDATVTYPTFTTPTPTTPGTGPTTPTSTVWTPDPICPYPSDELTYVLHPTNCSMYYECYQGLKYLMACPGDLVFNIDAKYCDYPANVDCNREPTTPTTTSTTPDSTGTTPTTDPTGTTPTTDPTGTTPTTPTTPPTPPTPTTGTTPTTTTGAPSNVCANVPDGTFLSDPDDCRIFYECLWGNVIASECPQHLLWNEQKLTCDYPENVVCDKENKENISW